MDDADTSLDSTDSERTRPSIETVIEHSFEAERKLRERYKATDARVVKHRETPELTLEFEGFKTLDVAIDRARTVAMDLRDHPAIDAVHLSVGGEGQHPRDDEDRPYATVNASVVDAERLAELRDDEED